MSLKTVANTRLIDWYKLDNITVTNPINLDTIATDLSTTQAELASHEANLSNPHAVTQTQVGLWNVDNTSDINKPVSTAQQAAINEKIDDSVYWPGWNGDSTHAPSRNAVYDKIESMAGGLGTVTNVSSANADATVANQTTTPVITIVSAPKLTTAKSIYWNSFDWTADLTQVIASTYGGTGNGFTKFTGPTTTERTFTLPDSNATLLYSGWALWTPSSWVATNLTGTASWLSIGWNAATVTNGVYTSGSYSDPTWITWLAWSKISGNISWNSANVTGTVAIANGGTGQTSAQNAINALTQVASATNEYVLTKDTGTGNATWKASWWLIFWSSITWTSGTGISINKYWSPTQATSTTTLIDMWANFNTNSSFSWIWLNIYNHQNAWTWYNTGIVIENYSISPDLSNSRWVWIIIKQNDNWVWLAVQSLHSSQFNSNGLFNISIANANSTAAYMWVVNTGTSAHDHYSLYITWTRHAIYMSNSDQAPSVTTNKLYAVWWNLYWGATQLDGGVWWLTWWSTISWNAWTWFASTINNSASAWTIWYQWTISNTQTQDIKLINLDTWTSNTWSIWLYISSRNHNTSASAISIDMWAGNTNWTAITISTSGINSLWYWIKFSDWISNWNTGYWIYQNVLCNSANSVWYGIYQNILWNWNWWTSTWSAIWWYVANLRATNWWWVHVPTAKWFSLNNAQSANLVWKDITVDTADIIHSRTNTATTWTVDDNFNQLNIKRTSIQNGSGWTLNSGWSVLRLENIDTQTAWTLTSTVDVLKIIQSSISTWSWIYLSTAWTWKRALKFDTWFTTTVAPTWTTKYIIIDIWGTEYKLIAQATS